MIKQNSIINLFYKKYKKVFKKNEIARIINTFWSIINNEMIAGNKITIANIGIFTITKQGKREKGKHLAERQCIIKNQNYIKRKRFYDKVKYWKELAEYNQWSIANGHKPHHRLPANLEGRKSKIIIIKHRAINE